MMMESCSYGQALFMSIEKLTISERWMRSSFFEFHKQS